jgi:hypothetical protein
MRESIIMKIHYGTAVAAVALVAKILQNPLNTKA